jgi:ABC-type glycerol-3-phosphate transport system substrate-binding protein
MSKLSRREFLRRFGALGAGLTAMAAGCQPQTVIVEKEVERPVTQIVEVEKEVTRIVEGTPVVEKVIETQVVEKVVKETVVVQPELEEITLRWQVNPFAEDDIAEVWDPLIEKWFDAGHEHIQIETEILPWSGRREKMMTAFAGNQSPDVTFMNVDMVWNFASAGALADLGEVISAAVVSDTPQSMQDLCYIGGKLYMIPFNTGANSVRVYNKDLMAEVGWDPEVPPDNWDDILELGPMALEMGLYAIQHSLNGAQWNYLLWQAGGRRLLEDEEGNVIGSNVDSPEVRETWQFLKTQFDNGWSPIEFVTMQIPESAPNYFLQKQLLITGGTSAQGNGTLTKQAEEEGIANWSTLRPLKHKQRAANSSDTSIAMFSASEYKSEGGAWLAFIMEPDIMAEWSNRASFIPSRASARASSVWEPTRLMREYSDITNDIAVNKDRYFYFREGYQTINPELHAYILGYKGLEEAIMTAHEAMDAVIQEDLES